MINNGLRMRRDGVGGKLVVLDILDILVILDNLVILVSLVVLAFLNYSQISPLLQCPLVLDEYVLHVEMVYEAAFIDITPDATDPTAGRELP